MAYVKSTPVAETVPFDNDSNGFTADDVQTAIEEAKQNSEGFPRAAIRGVYNGVVGNNSWLGPSELLPNTALCIFPVNTKLNEITWSNQKTNVAFRIEFRTGSKTGTIFYTLTITSPNVGYGYVSGLNFTFPAGTSIWAQYKDDGTNCSDMALDLWISRIP
jgi:hypothetical protein